MRTIGAHTAVVSAVATLGLAAAASAAQQAAPWAFAGIGASERTLRLTVGNGGCERPIAPRVVEGATVVRVTARVERPDDPGVACTADYRYGVQTVTLERPLAGRRLLGATLDAPGGSGGPVPRVVGLATADAVAVLRARGLRPTVRVVRRPGLRRVTGQSGLRLTSSR